MFTIGEIVVHPAHGKGSLKEIKEMVVLGKSTVYYVFTFSDDLDKIMIPIDKVAMVGIRRPVERNVLDSAMGYLESTELDVPDPRSNFHRVHKEYSERIARGDILEVAKVFKALWKKGVERDLGLKDKLLFEKTEQLLVGEIGAICKLTPEASKDKLRAHVIVN